MPRETPSDPLEASIHELEGQLKRGRMPHRHDVRALLIELGGRLEDAGEAPRAPGSPASTGASGDLEGLEERLRRAAGEHLEAWHESLRGELALACAEHVHSVDERYLDLPNYDIAYTLAARERLAARLRAAAFLGIEAPPALMESVRRADELLERRRQR